MIRPGGAFAANVRWELLRLNRSRRIWLLAVAPIAGPIGSLIADLYLGVPSTATARVLGLLVTGGLSGLVILDLSALAVGEELTLRSHLPLFALPQSRRAILGGRLLVALGLPLLSYAVGATAVWFLTGAVVHGSSDIGPLFVPSHLALALPALLLLLGGVTAVVAVFTRSPSGGLVVGLLTGVVVAGATGYLLFEHEVSWIYPTALALIGFGAISVAGWTYGSLDG